MTTITALPTPPSRSDSSADFISKSDAFIAALPQFITELNAMGTAYNLATTATSSSSVLIGTGSKTFTVPAGLGFVIGQSLTIANTATPANRMYGQVTSYSGTTLIVNITAIGGSGTFVAWSIALAAEILGATLGANTFTGLQNLAAGANIESASTVDLTAATGNTVSITGTTAITAFTMNAGQQMTLIAAASLPLNYHATTMNIIGNASYTCAAGDRLYVVKDFAGVIRVNVIKQDGTAVAGASAVSYGLFRKSDPTIVAWSKTGNFTVSSQVTLYIEINGVIKTIASGTAVSMPAATTGTDYAIWANPDGTLQATSNFTSPPVAGARKVGGFHYSPGGHSGSPGGGNTTPQINQYSFYDLKFRPECQDPRGMTLVAGGFWADIYLLGVDHLTNGTSKYNVTMADGASPPKIPSLFGGNGTTAYGSLTWWESAEVMKSWGKRLPRYDEFAALAYGTTEASSVGTDQGSTVWNAAYVSKWGCDQVSGVMYQWGADFGGGAAAAGWVNNTNGRGQTYQLPNAVLLGGVWGDGASAGSRISSWSASPTYSGSTIGARGVCDHVVLD